MTKVSLAPTLLALAITSWLEGATLQGYVRDEKGNPIDSAKVTVLSTSNGASPRELTAATDRNGTYRLSLHEGTYLVRAMKADLGEAKADRTHISETEVRSLDLVLRPSEAPSFFDEPKFTVAGVTDNVYAGGHGSEAVVRSAESLTKATAALGRQPTAAANATPASDANLHHQIAEADEKTGRSLEAVREYQRAAELDASEANLFDWGTELLVHRAPHPARSVFEQGIKLFPNSSRMLLADGAALFALGLYSEAAQRLFQATDLNPSNPVPYTFLAAVQRPEIIDSLGFSERLARFAKLQPDDAQANYLYAGSLWRSRKNFQEVEFLLQKAVRLDQDFAPAYLQLGIVYADTQNLPAAIDALQKAIQIDPQLEQAHYRLAQAYRSRGQLAQAKLESAIFQQLSRASNERVDRERSELQKFVVSLRDPATTQ